MNDTTNSYYPKLSRFERRKLSKSKKIEARKKLMREGFAK